MYPNYQQTFTPQQNQLIQQMLNSSYNQVPNVQQECHVTRVNGEPGARSYMMPPNSDAVLVDTTASMIWLVQTDGAGYKSLTPFDILPHKEPNPEDESIKKLEDRISRLEEKITNAKSYDSSIKPYIPNSRPKKQQLEQCDAPSGSSNDKG